MAAISKLSSYGSQRQTDRHIQLLQSWLNELLKVYPINAGYTFLKFYCKLAVINWQ